MLTRRDLIAASAALLVSRASAAEDEFAALEAAHGGRLGVAAWDTSSNKRIAHRADERFAMCSTFKLWLAIAVLHRVDMGHEKLDRMIPYGKKDLLSHSPITEAHVGEGKLPIETLCAAAVTESDNCAANLLIASLGGPSGVTGFLRSIGDKVTRLDRMEIALNDVAPGDVRDTTTPNAMVGNLAKLPTGELLAPPLSDKLANWLIASTIGQHRIRAGLPAGWHVGDRSGTWDGANNATNDIVIAAPPDRGTILIAAYYAGSKAEFAQREAVLAEVGRIVVRRFA